MALISEIRKRSWIVLVTVALGVGGFIIMDMVNSTGPGGTGSLTRTLGKVNGEKIDVINFDNTFNMLYGNSGSASLAARNALWEYTVEEILVKEEAEELGLGVSEPELEDLQFGPRPSQIIQQRFPDPNNPQALNREQLNQIKQIIEEDRVQEAIDQGQLAPNFTAFWEYQKKEITKDRLQSKMGALVAKAMYTPTWMAEMLYNEQNQAADVAYVKVPYDKIENTEVSLEDKDFEAYISENQGRLKRDAESRKLQLAIFEVAATKEDSMALEKRIADLIPNFQTAENDSQFVFRNEGRIDEAYFKKADLPAAVADTVFDLAVGSVYGPYIDANSYNAIKILDKMVIPDSVQSRHILRPASNPMELAQARKTIDSLKTLIEAGTHRFDSLATKFGTDGTKTKGGDLGYYGMNGLVKPFNDLIFFKAVPGKVYVCETQFGVHLVEVMNKKFINNEQGVKVAYLAEPIVPSQQTQSNIRDKADEMMRSNRTLEALIKAVGQDPSVKLENSPLLGENDFEIQGLTTGSETRELVRWAFSSDVGDVTPSVYAFRDETSYYDKQFVIAGLKTIQPAGLPTVENIRDEVEEEVINRKKAELIKQRLSGKDLAAAAADFGVPVDTARNMSFFQSFIPNVGNEPAVVGHAFKLNAGQKSDAIRGASGVFVLQVITKGEIVPAQPDQIASVRNRNNLAAGAGIQNTLIAAMKKQASVKDKRAKFF
ncbi:MAG: peptidylprolyl isomerase [Saprospiraceae bacterium]|nr:peptidylprolyl isomerase [Saprospiraceae bacterium]